jgi:hypothetical protein
MLNRGLLAQFTAIHSDWDDRKDSVVAERPLFVAKVTCRVSGNRLKQRADITTDLATQQLFHYCQWAVTELACTESWPQQVSGMNMESAALCLWLPQNRNG